MPCSVFWQMMFRVACAAGREREREASARCSPGAFRGSALRSGVEQRQRRQAQAGAHLDHAGGLHLYAALAILDNGVSLAPGASARGGRLRATNTCGGGASHAENQSAGPNFSWGQAVAALGRPHCQECFGSGTCGFILTPWIVRNDVCSSVAPTSMPQTRVFS